MKYLKPEQRDAEWLADKFDAPLPDLLHEIEVWVGHTRRHLANDDPEHAHSAFWQISDTIDVVWTRVSDARSELARKGPPS